MFHYKNGNKFNGKFENDDFWKGTYSEHNGDIYHGAFKDGKRHGYVSLISVHIFYLNIGNIAGEEW